MRHYLSATLFAVVFFGCTAEKNQGDFKIEAKDVHNFWTAYDLAAATSDSATQADILEREFFAPGSPGLAAIMKARRYTKEEYRLSIKGFPKFWASMRTNMLKAPDYADQIRKGAAQFFDLYPQQLPVEIYLTVGCFRTNGTIMDSLLLIGTELALAGPETDLSEWPKDMERLHAYMESNPINGLVFLNTHEFVHTQQPTRQGYNLLGQCIFEGVPEFMATLALNQASTSPAIAYGKENDERVKAAFAQEMGTDSYYNWLQNDANNQFGIRDLGYYIGYALAEQFYNAAEDKQVAVKELIEMDYNDAATVNKFVDKLGYFERPVAEYLADYNANRPRVTHISQFENNALDVNPDITEITLHFSIPLNNNYMNNELGPLGKDYVPKIDGASIAEDGLSATYQVRLEPGRKYQFTLGRGFRTNTDMRLIPYTLTFTTQ